MSDNTQGYLALTRRPGESIILTLANGETITIMQSLIKGNQSKVSIKAPRDVKILRAELVGK